jgi:hypothetical protein
MRYLSYPPVAKEANLSKDIYSVFIFCKGIDGRAKLPTVMF